MSMRPWARLARITVAGALLASVVGASGASIVAAQEEASDCSAIEGGVQLPEAVEGKFNIGMVLIGPHNDGGWSEAHFDGLRYVCENMDNVHVAYMENVPEGADSEQVFRSLARKGFDFIIGTSFGFMDTMEIVAEEFPDTTFLHVSGYKSNGENFGNIFGAMEDFKYLAGMLAGSRAKVDGNPKLGYMATFPIPEELRLGNAIMLGALKTCPECTMDVRWINTWHDPTIEREAAASLFDAGAQVVFTGADTPAPAAVAEELGTSGASPTTGPGPAPVLPASRYRTGSGGPSTRVSARSPRRHVHPGWEYFDADSGSMGLYGFMEGETRPPGLLTFPRRTSSSSRTPWQPCWRVSSTASTSSLVPSPTTRGNLVLAEGEKLEPGRPGVQFSYMDGPHPVTCLHGLVGGGRQRCPA